MPPSRPTRSSSSTPPFKFTIYPLVPCRHSRKVEIMHDPALTTEQRHRLLTVLRELDVHAPPEQRRHPRRNVQLTVTLRPLGERRAAPRPALLINISVEGVGLQVENPLDQGRKFLLPLRFVEGGGWLVLCEVRSCSPFRRAFKLGARILDHIDDPTGTATSPMDWLL
jgi:hypothetical protein